MSAFISIGKSLFNSRAAQDQIPKVGGYSISLICTWFIKGSAERKHGCVELPNQQLYNRLVVRPPFDVAHDVGFRRRCPAAPYPPWWLQIAIEIENKREVIQDFVATDHQIAGQVQLTVDEELVVASENAAESQIGGAGSEEAAEERVSTSISSMSISSMGETRTNSPNLMAKTMSGEIGQTSAAGNMAIKDMLPTFTCNELVISKQELSSGAHGRVYIATTRVGTKFAVKTLKTEKMATLTQAEVDMHINLLYEEAKLLFHLKHPNILSLYIMISDFDNGFPGMATELMSENSLYHCLQRGDQRVRSWAGILSVIGQVVDAMVYLHDEERSIVHFDLKSSNILVEYSSLNPNNPICRLGDFGLAVVNKGSYLGLIRLNNTRGTAIYMAPEVILAKYQNQFVTGKVDVYSFGLLMWELAMGVTPHDGLTTEHVEINVITNGLRPNVPADSIWGWNELMVACWDKDGNQRPTFQEIRTQLNSIIVEYNYNLIMNRRRGFRN